MPSTWTDPDLRAHFDLFLDPGEADAWSAYELADAIERCDAPIEDVAHTLAPIGGLDRPDRQGMTALMATCAVSDYPTEAVVRLLGYTDPSRSHVSSLGYPRTALGYALQRRTVDVAMVTALLTHGVDPSAPCSGPHNALQLAVDREHATIVAHLVSQGCDPLAKGGQGLSALDLALRKAREHHPGDDPNGSPADAMVVALLEQRPDLSGWTSGTSQTGWPWHDACHVGPVALCALLDAGLSLDLRNTKTHETALHRRMNDAHHQLRSGDSCWPLHRATIVAMLGRGVPVDSLTAEHETLWWPVFNGANFNVDLCDLLIRAGLPFDATIRDDDRSPMRSLVESHFGPGSAELYRLEQAELARAWKETLPTDPTPGVPRPRL